MLSYLSADKQRMQKTSGNSAKQLERNKTAGKKPTSASDLKSWLEKSRPWHVKRSK